MQDNPILKDNLPALAKPPGNRKEKHGILTGFMV